MNDFYANLYHIQVTRKDDTNVEADDKASDQKVHNLRYQ